MADMSAWSEAWGVEEKAALRLVAVLRKQLGEKFGQEKVPLWRPTATGQWLLEHSGVNLTPLPEEVRQLIVSTSCQHRMELLWQGGPRYGEFTRDGSRGVYWELPSLCYYDGRAMYMGLTGGEIGCGPVAHRRGSALCGEDRGRCRVRFRVPSDWQHIGLLAVKDPDRPNGWLWPSEPRSVWETWADCAEVRFAERQGWGVEVEEALLLQPAKPLQQWGGALASLYRKAKDAGDDTLAGCYRAICLNTIGACHNLGTYTKTEAFAEGDEALIPAGGSVEFEAGRYVRRTRERLQLHNPERWSHPEWSSAIWSLTHLRVAKALLWTHRKNIVGVRGDGIFMTDGPSLAGGCYASGDDPWKDDGKPGRLRLKGSLAGPLPAPRNLAELSALGRRAECGG